MRIFGVILAGGAGRRLGGADKALQPLRGRPLARHLRDRLGPQVERLAISANGDASRLAFLGLPVLADAEPLGPLAGILAGLDWAAAEGAAALVSAPVDAPFLPCDLVPRLVLAGGGGTALARSGGRDHAATALWPVDLREALRAHLAAGGRRVAAFADGAGAARADFADDGAFRNLNTPDDLARAEGLLA